MIEQLKERREELIAQRERFIQEANGQIGAFNGAIAELERLIQLLADEADDAAGTKEEPAQK
jgi:hypothetical protein